MRQKRILTAILLIATGWFLNAWAWTTSLGHPYNTIMLVAGIGGIIAGIIFLIRALTDKVHTHNKRHE